MQAFRLADPRFDGQIAQAMSGDGGLYGPGRWHLKGFRIVYLASSLALCTLEMKVQDSGVKPAYAAFEVLIPDSVSRREVDMTWLPADWRDRSAYPACQAQGVAWLLNPADTAVLIVPSAVVMLEKNFLLNPQHPQASLVKTRSLGIQATDPRLLGLPI